MPVQDIPPEKLTPANDLRELIRQCELRVVALKGSAEEAATFLQLMDKAHSLFCTLEAKEIDLRAERVRWETIKRQLSSQAAVLVREVGAAGGLAQLREAAKPTPDRWWWFLDQELRQGRRQSLRRVLIGGGIALIILIALGFLYRRFLAPDPITRQAIHLSYQAEQFFIQGDLEAALDEYEALYEITPNDPEANLWMGVLYKSLGRDKDSTQAFARSRELMDSEEDFLAIRGMIYLETGWEELALVDAKAILGLNPKSAMGYLILGSAHEAQEHISEAVAALQRAAELADAQGDSTLYALIKMRLGVLMGGSGGMGL